MLRSFARRTPSTVPNANIMLDSMGQISQWNARAQRLFGYAAADVLGERFTLLFAGGENAASAALQSAAEAGYLDFAVEAVRKSGERFPAQALMTLVSSGSDARGFSLVVQDIAERSHAQQQRRDDNARLLSVIQSAMDPIITIDEEQNIVLFNAAAESTFRCPATVALGTNLERFIPQPYRDVHRGHIERFAATGITMRRMGGQLVLTGLRADGEEFPLEASISQVTIEGKKLFTVILRDVTERQRAREELEHSHGRLRELYEAMHEVREAERTRIARELHDELAQWLTALKMDAAWVAARLPAEPALSEKMQRILSVINTTVTAVRRIAADLRPVMLDDLGLVPAIENLTSEFAARTGIAVEFDVAPEDIEVQEPHATAVYRMVQEALTNVARHAHATRVHAKVRAQGPNLEISVRDNGKGLDPSALASGKSFGLLGIRERAQTLGGSARIYSPGAGGTVVEIVVPLEALHAERSAR